MMKLSRLMVIKVQRKDLLFLGFLVERLTMFHRPFSSELRRLKNLKLQSDQVTAILVALLTQLYL